MSQPLLPGCSTILRSPVRVTAVSINPFSSRNETRTVYRWGFPVPIGHHSFAAGMGSVTRAEWAPFSRVTGKSAWKRLPLKLAGVAVSRAVACPFPSAR